MQTINKKSLTVKDLVTVGIFSALFLVFALVGGIFFAPNPVLTFYMPVGSALLCGPVYLLMLAKVQKRWAASLLGALLCIVWFVTGMHWAMALGYLVMGIIADFVAGTGGYKSKKINSLALSGGEKQKIAFASVYAMGPEIYLLDEPSSNLDMTAIGELCEHLKLIKARGKTAVVAEHRLYYLMEVADRIIYLEDGRIAGDWTPEQFRSIPLERRCEMGLRSIDLSEERPGCAAPTAAAPVIELRDVTLAYQKQPVLQNVSLQAAPGDVIAVVGHNGAGKTTFSRALCGLHKETSGSYLWNGKPQKPKERMKRSYMVMQDVNYQLFAESVEAECTFGIKHPDTELAEKTLTELGLAPFRERHPNTLSGGQKQRLAAAASMVCDKELLVFDEPTSGLDYDSMARLAALIQKLSVMGKVIFIVTHDYEFACRTCLRVLHLDGGGILDDLTVSEENIPKIKELFDVR